MVFSSFYHGQPLFPKWFCDRKLSFCDGSAETSIFIVASSAAESSGCPFAEPWTHFLMQAFAGLHSSTTRPIFTLNANLSGRGPSILLTARPFGRLKAPLGLSLLRFAVQTRTTFFLLCTKSCIVWRKIGVWCSSCWKSIKRKSLKLLGTSRSFRLF